MVKTLSSLYAEFVVVQEKLHLIRERKAEYVLVEDIPLQLVKNERILENHIDAFHTHITDIQQRCIKGCRLILRALGQQHSAYTTGQKALQHLLANLKALQNASADNASERAQIVARLDHYAHGALGTSFSRVCGLPENYLSASAKSPPATVPETEDQQAPDHTADGISSHHFRQGIDALMDLMQIPSVYTHVTIFRTDFQMAQQHVRILIYFKDLHDHLHALQYRCYNLMLRDAARFPGDEIVRESLIDYEMTLSEIIRGLRGVIARSEPTSIEPDWINELSDTAKNVRQAIEQSDGSLLNRVLRRIDRILATQPVYINANLIATARALPLSDLIEALYRLRDQLHQLDLDTTRLARFEDGVDGLSHLSMSLTRLVHDHDAWQEVERELWRIEATLRHDTTELELFWVDIKAKVAPMYETSSEEWAEALKQDTIRLEHALMVKEPAQIRAAFRRYRRQAGDRFFRIDADLKRLCDRLRQFGDPLNELQHMFELQRVVGR
jgi:hypothetical protein